HACLDSWSGRRHDGPPAYAEVIQAINAVAEPEDYILSAAGGLPGELSMGWDNGCYAVINRLQVNTGGAEFNNLLATTRHERDVRVDFVKHAESMGAI